MQSIKFCHIFLTISFNVLWCQAPQPTKFFVTGSPGAGKTTLILGLEINYGFDVIREAASDIIALELSQNIKEPWLDFYFDAKILALQIKRLTQSNNSGKPIFCDRSPIDIYAYAEFHNVPLPAGIDELLAGLLQDPTISKTALFVESLSFLQNTAIRRETFEEAQKIKALLFKYYNLFGFTLVSVPDLPLNERIEFVVRIFKDNAFDILQIR